ncbi:MAG: hypothetical protein KAH57_03135 [Thermoplasmata archaeon]|nr:hypothetical protein [Thermoplasmata archaeon]
MQNFEIVAKIKEQQAKLEDVRSEEDLLHVQLRNKISEVKEAQKKRDELNDAVKELSQKPKGILTERKDIWDNIKGTNEDKRKLLRQMQPYLQRIGELRRIRDEYNDTSRGTLERLLENIESTREALLSFDINLKNELYLYSYLFELQDRLLIKKEADLIHREIVRIKEEELSRFNKKIEKMEGFIGEMKERSHSDLKAAKGLWSERDSMRELAQKEHRRFLEINGQIREIKRAIGDKRHERNGIWKQINNWRDEFKKSGAERQYSDNNRRLLDARAKFKKGDSLSLDEMGLLLEAGDLK